MSGPLAPQRTGVMLALMRTLIAGFQMMRQMMWQVGGSVGLAALAKAEPKALVEVLDPLFEHLLA